MTTQHNTRKKNRLAVLSSLFFSLISVMAIAAVPSTANAGGKIHLDLPGISIGVHGDRHYKKRHRRIHRNHHRHYDSHSYDSYRYKRKYRPKSYDRYYDNKRNYYGNRNYYDNYYYGGNSRRYYNNRRGNVCPDPGYSPYYNDNLSCYRHKDHFHCS